MTSKSHTHILEIRNYIFSEGKGTKEMGTNAHTGTPPECNSCGVQQTVTHILTDCDAHEDEREQLGLATEITSNSWKTTFVFGKKKTGLYAKILLYLF